MGRIGSAGQIWPAARQLKITGLDDSDNDFINLVPFLEDTGDLSSIECSTQVFQSLAFITVYAVHKYLKHHKPCHVSLIP